MALLTYPETTVVPSASEPSRERLLEGIADALIVADPQGQVTYMNARARELCARAGMSAEPGRSLSDALPLDSTELEGACRRAMTNMAAFELEAYVRELGSWFAVRGTPSRDGVSILLQDVTRRKQAEASLAAEKALLELILSGAPLERVLEELALSAEAQSTDGLLCSVLLLDEEGRHLLHGAAPSLPAEYNERIHGLEIGPGVGSCGSAAHGREPVWVTDISDDPKWEGFKDLAAAHGLGACCSAPLLAGDGTVLGTIAMYYRRPWNPSERDREIIEFTARLATVAIERRRAEQARRASEQFNRSIIESSRDCFKILTLDGVLTWISAMGTRALCIADLGAVLGKSWIDFWQGEDRARATEAVRRAAQGDSGAFLGHFPVAGQSRWWDVVVTAIRDADGRPSSLLAVSRDVTERIVAEERLRDSEQQLRQLADSIPQLAWMAEPDGHIFWYNRGWYEYTGTTLEQMQGWGWQSVHDPEWLPQVVERWQQSLASGAPFEMEFPLRGADGAFRWFLTRVNPVRDAEGRVTRWFGTNTNVDQVNRVRRALEEERRVLELLNETNAKLGSNLDLQALLQSVTDAATQLSGGEFGAFFYNVLDDNGEAYMLYTLSGAPREAFEKFGKPRATPVFAPTFRGEGVVRSDDISKDARYGQWGPHHGMPPGHLPVRSYLAVPVRSRSGEVLGGLFFGHSKPGVFTERSERLIAGVAAQAGIAVDNARLYQAAQRSADERKLLLESERHARAAAERASRMKDEFLATLSHELRTPLSSILGWAHVLRGRAQSPEQLQKGLEAIERNARAQTQLIEELLDMSRITSGKIRLDVQPVDPAAFVEAALETVRPAAEAKGIRIEKVLDPSAPPISGDPSRLQQVVWNLLNNAIKFTPAGGRIQVVLQRSGSGIELSVADTGVGLDPQFVPHLFERFRQADSSTTRKFGGLGLGLAIVKHLVELHGGTITARSAGLDQGSTFTVTLPVMAVRAEPAPARETALGAPGSRIEFTDTDLGGVRVLVVDDQPDAREVLARVLAECNAQVIEAGSAPEALALIERHRPDVLVSDIGMPDMDGYELLRRVRATPAGSGLPAVALTAFARSEDRTRALRAGFQVHVAKPVEPAELVATVASVAPKPAR